MTPPFTGHCHCGAIRFQADARPLWQSHCHCESCRRTTGSGFTSFLGMANGHWRWTGQEPKLYISSPGVQRYFCPTCGTPMAYSTDRIPGEMHFYAATLDRPEDYEPTAHEYWEEHMPWIALADGLPHE